MDTNEGHQRKRSSEELTNSSETDTSTDETDPTGESTDGAESQGVFDVDTIFTSGTFEIAAGGGNPDDSIFQGEVELAQMKMTRTMAPGLLNSGKHLEAFGIDLNGLDISGTVDAAYYRAGTAVPGSVLTLPDIGSSNEIDASTGTDIDATSDTDALALALNI